MAVNDGRAPSADRADHADRPLRGPARRVPCALRRALHTRTGCCDRRRGRRRTDRRSTPGSRAGVSRDMRRASSWSPSRSARSRWRAAEGSQPRRHPRRLPCRPRRPTRAPPARPPRARRRPPRCLRPTLARSIPRPPARPPPPKPARPPRPVSPRRADRARPPRPARLQHRVRQPRRQPRPRRRHRRLRGPRLPRLRRHRRRPLHPRLRRESRPARPRSRAPRTAPPFPGRP